MSKYTILKKWNDSFPVDDSLIIVGSERVYISSPFCGAVQSASSFDLETYFKNCSYSTDDYIKIDPSEIKWNKNDIPDTVLVRKESILRYNDNTMQVRTTFAKESYIKFKDKNYLKYLINSIIGGDANG